MLALLGVPDYLGCIRGRFIALELKRSFDVEPSKLQRYVLGRIKNAGGIALEVSPGTSARCMKILWRVYRTSPAPVDIRPSAESKEG